MSTSAPSALQAPAFAGFWRRAGAFAIDSFLLALPVILVGELRLGTTGLVASLFLPLVIDWLYYATMHSSGWQATLGKRIFQIKVTDLAGDRIRFGRATARYVAGILSALILLLGYFMAAFTRRRQALHDKIAGTLVVSTSTGPNALPADRAVMPLPPRMRAAIVLVVVASFAGQMIPAYVEEEPAEHSGTPVAPDDKTREEIAYAIYNRPLWGDWKLVKEGTRTYAHSDLLAVPGPATDTPNWLKFLPVSDGFAIEARVYREPQIDGFGLSLIKDGGGFSWEWFDRESGDIFRKRQGPGQVQARFVQVDGKEELAEIFFLDDIAMRLDRYWLVPFSAKGGSDRLIVRKGSVLWLSK